MNLVQSFEAQSHWSLNLGWRDEHGHSGQRRLLLWEKSLDTFRTFELRLETNNELLDVRHLRTGGGEKVRGGGSSSSSGGTQREERGGTTAKAHDDNTTLPMLTRVALEAQQQN